MTPSRLFYGFEAQAVCDPQRPLDRESLLSWIARTTIEYELPNITTILRDVGQVHRNRAVDVMRKSIDVEGLATILGEDLPVVERLRGEDLGNGSIRYLGSTIKASDLHTKFRRFAPASLGLGETPFYRASWLVRTFPVCTESWQALRTTCDCGTAQTWASVSTTVLCEGCGEDLREGSADAVPLEAQPGLSFLADILFGEKRARATAMARLPTELAVLDPGEVYELALLLARVIDPTMANPRENVWRDEPIRLARALAKAADVLPLWPDSPWLALAEAGDPRAMVPRSHPLKKLYRVLNRDYAPGIAVPVGEALDSIRRSITLDEGGPPIDLVDLNDAERILCVGKSKIRAARVAGHLECHFVIRRGEILPGYSRTELVALAATTEWPSPAVVEKQIGLPCYGVEQLCATDEISWAKAPQRTLRTGLRIDPRSIESFERSLRESAVTLEDVDDPIPLTTVMRGIGGREKPWAAVLRGLVEGRWRFALGGNGRVIREICVARGDMDAIRLIRFDRSDWHMFPFANTINQGDACDILNVPLRSRSIIERYKAGERRRAWLFNRGDVIELSGRVVTSSELCARYLLKPKTAAAAVQRSKLRHLEFGFERTHAVPAFDAVLDRRKARRAGKR